MLRVSSCLLALVSLVLGVSHARAEEAVTERGWEYRVRFEPGLARAHVNVTFQGWHPKRLILTRFEALRALRLDPTPRADGRPPFRVNPARNGILPRIDKDGDGIAYTVDFHALARLTQAEKDTRFVGRDLVTRAGLFLLYPAVWPRDARVRVVLHLPAGTQPAVGWKPYLLVSSKGQDPTFELPREAMAPHARIAFGRFTPRRVTLPRGDIVYYVLDAPHRASQAGIEQWLRTAMGAVTQLYGKPPVPRTHVIVQPLVPGRGRPVVFGRATLSGGPLVHVMLSGTTSDASMPGEWITIHEMLHLGMPLTMPAHRWFGEGFVSYYQEVVRARAGIITPQEAWQSLHTWFERGKRSGGKRTLREESLLMNNRYAYHRVYWGGAALALKLDVMLRTQTAGRSNLDDVMRHFLAHDVDPARLVDPEELLRQADRLAGSSSPARLIQQALGSKAFPDLRGTYAALGLRVIDDRIVLGKDAPAAQHRDAIMRAGGR